MQSTIRLLRYLLVASALYHFPATAQAPALPDELRLEYTFSYESIEVGRATKHLRRQGNNRYVYSLHMRPTGMARLLTSVEWVEEGEFMVEGNTIRPMRFTEIRKGDKRAYERRATFDWEQSLLVLNDGRKEPLAPGTQDQGSIIYSFMLDPITGPDQREVHVTDGKDVDPYTLSYQGREVLRTPVGRLETIVIKRLSQKQLAREKECADSSQAATCPVDDFIIWVAPDRRYVAVKIQRRKNGQTLTLVLRNIEGL